MKWSDFERYLKGEHLAGKRPIVTIEEIVIEETHPPGQAAEEKPVAYFVGKSKGLILSPTNQRALRAMFGDDVQACRGKTVMLEVVPMLVAGKNTLPIRISPAPQSLPQPAAPAPAPKVEPTAEDLNGWNDIEKITPAADIKPAVPGK